MSELLNAGSLMALLSLTTLEIVLGIDNVVFLAVLAGLAVGLPREVVRAGDCAHAAVVRPAVVDGEPRGDDLRFVAQAPVHQILERAHPG